MAWPVLLLARELDLGGSERQITEIAKTLDRSRFNPHVGCFRPQGIRNAELCAAGVPIVHFPVNSFASLGALSEAWKLANYIRRHRIRLVHSFDYPLTLFGVPVARCLTRAVVVSSQRSHRSLIPRQIPAIGSMDGSYGGRHCGELRVCTAAPADKRRRSRRTDAALLQRRGSGSICEAGKSARCARDRRGLRAAAGEGCHHADRSLRRVSGARDCG